MQLRNQSLLEIEEHKSDEEDLELGARDELGESTCCVVMRM